MILEAMANLKSILQNVSLIIPFLNMSRYITQLNNYMKNIICFCIITLLSTKSILFAQDVNLTKESVSKDLCKKWKLDYAIDDGMKIAPIPGVSFNYEFKNDNTFIVTGNGTDLKGTWSYEPIKKLVRLNINNIINSEIISLKENELITITDTKSATPSDPTPIKMVFVPLD